MNEFISLLLCGKALNTKYICWIMLDMHFRVFSPDVSQYSKCFSHRESQSPTFPQDLTETTGGDSAGHRSPHDDADSFHKSYLDVQSPESGGVRSPSPSKSEFEPKPANGLVSASLQKSQTQDMDTDQDPTAGACTIRRALLRSRKARKEVKADISGFTQESGEIQTEHSPPQESFRASQNEVMEEQESASTADTVLLGYDAQWCWVESQDDVTFLWLSVTEAVAPQQIL